MARRGRPAKIPTTPEEIAKAAAEDARLAAQEETYEINELLRGMAGSATTVKIYEVDRYQKQLFRDELPLETLSNGSLEGFLRDEYGGGTFLIRLVQLGKYVKGGNRTIHIAPPRGDEYAAAPGQGAEHQTGAGLQLKMMEMQLNMSRESSERTMQMIQTMNGSIMGVITALIQNNRPMDPVALAGLMRSGGSGHESLTMVREVMALAKEVAPGGGGEDPLVGMLTSALPALIGRGATPAAAATTETRAQLPPATPPGTAEVKQVEGGAEQNEMQERLAFLKKLKDKAKAGADVEFWADYIEANQDEAACQWILAVVTAHPLEMVMLGLQRADEELKTEPYVSWFTKLYEALTTPEEIASASTT